MSDENLKKVFEKFKLDSVEDLYLNIGNNKFSAKSIVKQESDEEKPEEKEVKNVVRVGDSDILVGDTKNIEVHIANCCLPLPGDEIVGYITKTSGIRIHRKNCSNIELFEDRIIDATWNDVINNKYNSEIIIHSTSKENIIFDIVQAAAAMNIIVENVNLIYKSNNNVYSVDVLVKDLETMEKFIINLNKLKYVSDVERIMK